MGNKKFSDAFFRGNRVKNEPEQSYNLKLIDKDFLENKIKEFIKILNRENEKFTLSIKKISFNKKEKRYVANVVLLKKEVGFSFVDKARFWKNLRRNSKDFGFSITRINPKGDHPEEYFYNFKVSFKNRYTDIK